MIDPKYPEPDPNRAKRIVDDVVGLMKLNDNDAIRKKVNRWLELTLAKAKSFNCQPWWFARRWFSCMVYEGQDVFDLQNELDRIISVSCPKKLNHQTINYLSDRRATAATYQRSNLGEPDCYSIHGGRLHLWPAPDKEMMLTITYSCKLTADIVPDEWEPFLLDGIIGLFGAHFDNSGLLREPNQFVKRFYEGLKSTRISHFDTEPNNRNGYSDVKKQGMTISQAYAETNSADYSNAIIKPAYGGILGSMQILADKDSLKSSLRSTPIAQIPGDRQP